MSIDVSRDVVGLSTVEGWKKGEYASTTGPFILNTDHIVHMEEIRVQTHATTLVTLSDDRIVILVGSVADLKKKFRIP